MCSQFFAEEPPAPCSPSALPIGLSEDCPAEWGVWPQSDSSALSPQVSIYSYSKKKKIITHYFDYIIELSNKFVKFLKLAPSKLKYTPSLNYNSNSVGKAHGYFLKVQKLINWSNIYKRQNEYLLPNDILFLLQEIESSVRFSDSPVHQRSTKPHESKCVFKRAYFSQAAVAQCSDQYLLADRCETTVGVKSFTNRPANK